MDTPSMSLLPEPTVQFVYYDEYGRQVDQSYDPLFSELAAEPKEIYEQHQRIIRELAINKPKWVVTAEEIARRFLRQRVGIVSTAPVYLLREDPMLDDIGLSTLPSTVAAVDPFLGHIMAREGKLRDVYDEAGLHGAAGVFVHEGFHAAAPLGSIALHKTASDEVALRFRSGLATDGTKGIQGMFFEESPAVMLQAMCASKKKSLQPDLCAVATPSLELPPRYAQIQQPEKGKDMRIAGPDGYAMELLAWTAERRSIMPAHEFVWLFLATRWPEHQTQALRQLPKIVNAIRPGLYAELRGLQYGYEEWRKGLELVYEAATG